MHQHTITSCWTVIVSSILQEVWRCAEEAQKLSQVAEVRLSKSMQANHWLSALAPTTASSCMKVGQMYVKSKQKVLVASGAHVSAV